MLTLFYSPGACSLASHISLIESGLEFQIDKVDFENGSTERGEDWLQLNPKGYVPALRLENGEVFTENPAVQQIIAGLAPDAHVLPEQNSMERFRAIEWLAYLSSELHKAFEPLFHGASGVEKEEAHRKIAEKLKPIQEWFGRANEWLAKHWSGADAYLFVILSWTALEKVGFDLSPYPQLVSFMERMKKRPAVRQAMEAEGLNLEKTPAPAGEKKQGNLSESTAGAEATPGAGAKPGAEAKPQRSDSPGSAAQQNETRSSKDSRPREEETTASE